MAVLNLSQSLLNNDELLSLVSDTLEYVESAPKEDRTIQYQIQNLKTLVMSALGLSGKKESSEVTKQIQGIHEDRRKKRNDLVACVEGFLHNPKDQLKTAASVVMDIIDKYPLKKSRVPYSVLTNRINSLIKDLENHKEELSTLELTQFLDELMELQTNFELAKAKRVSESKSKLSTVEYKTVIDEIRDKFPQFLTNLDSSEQAFPDEYSEIVENINLIILDYLPSAKARNTRKENDKPDPSPSDKSQIKVSEKTSITQVAEENETPFQETTETAQ